MNDRVPVEQLRVPPHSAEAEQAVIGAVLLDNAAFDQVSDVLHAEHFYAAEHRAIWSTVVQLLGAGKPADVVTVHAAGGHALEDLNDLATGTLSIRNARRHALIVLGRWRARQLVGIADALATDAYTMADDEAEERIDRTVTDLLKLGADADAREPELLAELLPGWLDHLSAMAEAETDPAMRTGLADLDRLTSGGMRRGELWVFGARPSMGKSAMSLTIARNMAAQYGVLFLSQEDSTETLIARMVAAAGQVNLADLRNPRHAPDEAWHGVSDGVERLQSLTLRVDDQAGLTLLDVRRKIQHAKRRGAVDVVMVDYLQLMHGTAETRNRELGDIANGLKVAAKDFGVCIVLLSQLSRKADERSGPPQMSDLRESGDIEGAADVIGMLFREHMRRPTPENKHFAELHVCKSKNGPTDTISLHFDGRYQRFGNWDGPRPFAGTAKRGGGGGLD